jgi:hypothetical protein
VHWLSPWTLSRMCFRECEICFAKRFSGVGAEAHAL